MTEEAAAERLKEELKECINCGAEVTRNLSAEKPPKGFSFTIDYQRFYSNALRLMNILGPERLAEFCGYYEIDPKRKTFGYGTYAIQDYLKGVAPDKHSYPFFNPKREVQNALLNQLAILKSLENRIGGVLGRIAGGLLAELQDSELKVARELSKTSLRAAGALAGVVLEGHLQHVMESRKLPIKKKFPTISDLNDPLKSASVYDTATWRKISFLADIRNKCCHKKGGEPTEEQVEELIEGVNWVVKTVA